MTNGTRPKGSDGFALVEVLLALILMAMIAAVALPSVRPIGGATAMRTTAYQLTALLRDARTSAMTLGRPTGALVSPTRVSLPAGRAVDLPPGLSVRVSDRQIQAIAFAPNGTSSGGEILLQGAAAPLIISVNADTGAVRLATP